MINSTNLARSLVRQLIELGVCDFVVSPGSRNAPLLIALGEAADKSLIEPPTVREKTVEPMKGVRVGNIPDNFSANPSDFVDKSYLTGEEVGMFHVTTAKDRVLSEGLKPRKEVAIS